MAVDLFDLVDPLQRSVNAPGTDSFSTVTDTQWVGYLSDAFWSARIEAGLFEGYAINDDDEVVNTDGGDDLGRDYQQIIVLYAALQILTNVIRTTASSFRAKAGPAEFETSNAAGTQRDILAELQSRRDMVLTRLSDLGTSADVILDLNLSVLDNYDYSWVR